MKYVITKTTRFPNTQDVVPFKVFIYYRKQLYNKQNTYNSIEASIYMCLIYSAFERVNVIIKIDNHTEHCTDHEPLCH